MRFKAKLNWEPIELKLVNASPQAKLTLEFTKSQILFPKSATNLIFKNREIKHGVRYKLIANDTIDRLHKYQIVIGNGKPINLAINNINEIKLKWIHGIYLVKKELLASVAILISILALIVAILK